MNQIICTSSSTLELSSNNYIKKRLLKIIFYILVLISFFFTIYYIYFRCDIYKSEQISQKLLNDFSITSIYNNNSDYKSNFINNEILRSNYKDISSSVIGAIEIKKLNIFYPILSEINNKYLKISPCRFYGPLPNNNGNLCIAAHNYKNDSFFSNLSNLVNGDLITIYDLNGHSLDYVVYSSYTSSATDTTCMDQNTNNLKVITLITCDSRDNNFRTIVKAREF